MANYYGDIRSNYFKVKDVEVFKAWLAAFSQDVPFDVWDDADTDVIAFGASGISGGLPNQREILNETEKPDDEDGDWISVDFIDELSKHLVEGEVAIIQETGSEKLRYLIGFSVAVDWQGKTKWFNIDAVYKWVDKKYGKTISRCEY